MRRGRKETHQYRGGYLKPPSPGGARWSTGARRCEVCDARGDVDRYDSLDLKRVCRPCADVFSFAGVVKQLVFNESMLIMLVFGETEA